MPLLYGTVAHVVLQGNRLSVLWIILRFIHAQKAGRNGDLPGPALSSIRRAAILSATLPETTASEMGVPTPQKAKRMLVNPKALLVFSD